MKKSLCALAIATTLCIGGTSTNTFAATNNVPNENKTTSSTLKTLNGEIKAKREEIKTSVQTKIDTVKKIEANGVKKSVVKDSIKDLNAEKKAIQENNKSLKSEISDINLNIKNAKQSDAKSNVTELKKSLVEKKTVLKGNLDKILLITTNIIAKLNTL